MTASSFTHLCVHSYYSILEATPSIEGLVERAVSNGMTHLALTDSNALYGAVAFARACRKHGIEPLIGMTITVSAGEDIHLQGSGASQSGQLVLLADGSEGYRSLCRLSSLLQGNPDRELYLARGISLHELKASSQGLICLSGGRRGWIQRSIEAGNDEASMRFASRLVEIFGPENLFLSLEMHKPEDNEIAERISRIGDHLGLFSVAVQPIYCLLPSDTPRLKLLAAIDNNYALQDVPLHELSDGGDSGISLHWLSSAEISQRFESYPEAVTMSSEIAKRCDYPFPHDKVIWPAIELPTGKTADQALAELAREGLLEKYGQDAEYSIHDRLEKELQSIAQYGFAPFFLVVADIVRFARRKGIPVSSRGSVANSLAAYCVGITNVDPITNNLLFERFLSPARADLPDIDLDFCSRRRDEVLEYVRSKYGEEHVALVGTISTMKLRSALRETAKAYGLDANQINMLVRKLPRFYRDPRQRHHRTVEDLLEDVHDPVLVKVVEEAGQIVGQPHHLGVHPGGVVISPFPMNEVVPLQWASKGFLATQFDYRYIEELGLPKLDLLGVSALTVLSDAASLANEHYGTAIDLDAIPLDDLQTQDMICRGETVGVFQCESQGARSTLMKLKARTIRDMAVANAFFKPGPATGGMARSFVRRYRGEEKVSYLHPSLEPILGVTKGVLIFQEQILRVAREIAGLSWEQAGAIRRGMSKMRSREMAPLEEAFIQGCQRPEPDGRDLTVKQAEQLWKQVAAFSGYGFNQGHATAYAGVSYRMAYLKAHWPAAYLCARLMNWGGFHNPAVYMVEALRLGIDIRPPHINKSMANYSLAIEEGKPVIWMGLSLVRDLRHDSIEAIIQNRKNKPYDNLRDLLLRVRIQAKETTHLIQCGALDGLSASRAAMLAEFKALGQKSNLLQPSLFINESNTNTPTAPETNRQRQLWEERLLGYPISMLLDPLGMVSQYLPEHTKLVSLPEYTGKLVRVAGVRVPGWSGGEGFYLWDGETWVIAAGQKSSINPYPWEPLQIDGHWVRDEWGYSWLQVEQARELDKRAFKELSSDDEIDHSMIED